MPDAIKLNIGAGDVAIDGFAAIDRKLGSEAFPLPYADNSVEEIRASHILEHFDFADATRAMAEWVRVLKPGGEIRIAVPDAQKCLALAGDPDREEMWRFYLMGGQTDGDDYHKSCFSESFLRKLMQQSGLEDIRPWHSPNTDTAAHPVSLNLMGRKPVPELATAKICAIMSIPRVGWNDHWGSVIEALQPLRIPIHRYSGAFWGQGMQRRMNHCVKTGVDWILTLDYDTMFTAEHVDALIGFVMENPEIDAIAPLQTQRSSGFPLLSLYDPSQIEDKGEGEGITITGAPIRVNTAHFGLTLIKVEALKRVAKPWFRGQPDAEGDWGEDRLDDDIWFWHQWRLAGNTAYVAPSVRVGHLEVVVREIGEDMKPRLLTVKDWRKHWRAAAQSEDE